MPVSRNFCARYESRRAKIGVAQKARPHVHGVAGRVAHEILHQERHAGEQAAAAGTASGLGAGPLEERMNHRVQRWIQTFDARDRGVGEFERGYLAAANQVRLRGGVEKGDIAGHRATITSRP